MKTVFLLIPFFLLSNLYAQNPCPCCSENYQQFDFWLGEWEVFDTSYNWLGRNSLIKRENGCVIQESWSSQGSGTSLNYFDRTDSLWHQLWVASGGGNLQIYGGIKNGKMMMQSDLIPGRRIPYYRNRITWTPNSNGTVTQQWDIVDSSGNIIQTSFLGIYHPRIEIRINKPLGGYILVRNDSIFDFKLDLEKQKQYPKSVVLDWSNQLTLDNLNQIKKLTGANFTTENQKKGEKLALNYLLTLKDKNEKKEVKLAYENEGFKALLNYINSLKPN